MLVDLYKTKPGSLLTTQFSDFDSDQWQKLARHMCSQSAWEDYDPHAVRHILEIIGHTEVFDGITLAALFLHTAITGEDTQTIDFILTNFEHLNAQQDANPDYPTYLEDAVDNINAGRDQCYRVLDRLLTQFTDQGAALMSAVRWGNVDVVRKLLPHSNPSYSFYLPYRWAQVYNFREIETLLDPVSDKIHAAFGYATGRWSEPEDQRIAQKREMVLRKRIEDNEFDEPLALMYTRGLNSCMSLDQFEKFIYEDVYVLAMLWANKHMSNAHTALKSVERFEDRHAHDLIKHFRSAVDIIVPRLSAKAQQKILVSCAFDNDRSLADCLFSHGVDVNEAHKRLGNPSALLKMRNVPAIARNLKQRQNACIVFEQWISEWQAQKIREHIEMGVLKTPSKI